MNEGQGILLALANRLRLATAKRNTGSLASKNNLRNELKITERSYDSNSGPVEDHLILVESCEVRLTRSGRRAPYESPRSRLAVTSKLSTVKRVAPPNIENIQSLLPESEEVKENLPLFELRLGHKISR